ncbi:MAG TPA: hypothetical protein VFL64_08510 [Rhizobacter sp.]|nr:hypothetical protein [Rhizobacter sp.]
MVDLDGRCHAPAQHDVVRLGGQSGRARQHPGELKQQQNAGQAMASGWEQERQERGHRSVGESSRRVGEVVRVLLLSVVAETHG